MTRKKDTNSAEQQAHQDLPLPGDREVTGGKDTTLEQAGKTIQATQGVRKGIIANLRV